ncbi:uncharacterized protein [Lolium perenne]|uniref:uncharacterized protein n=1 Tax=Lolium perenne TaxID=4522 RepID=UPI003A99D811
MTESTCSKTVYKFCRAVIAVFGGDYLRAPRTDDTSQILAQNADRGFPGMLIGVGKIAFLLGKGCLRGINVSAMLFLMRWQTMTSGFGMAGIHNDINVLQRFPVFVRLVEGQASSVSFDVNGHAYNNGYYLADDIYPTYTTSLKTIPALTSEMDAYFASCQEAARKNVERAFDVL